MKRNVVLGCLLSFAVVAGCANSSRTGTGSRSALAEQETAKRELVAGTRSMQDRKLAAAEEHLQRCLVADPHSGVAHNNLGRVYYLQGKYYDAAWQFQTAIGLMPRSPEPLNNLGLVLEEGGRLDDAVKQYTEAVRLRPNDLLLVGNLARARVRRGDRDAETRRLLVMLAGRDKRTDWGAWAQQQLVLYHWSEQGPASDQPATGPSQLRSPP